MWFIVCCCGCSYMVFIVVGNYGVLVVVDGVNYGKVSGVVLRVS